MNSEPETQNRLTVREWGLRRLLGDIALFSEHGVGPPLRPYQLEPARVILDSVLRRQGHIFTVMMSRQAGKNELSAQLEAYLLNLFQRRGGTIVKAAPTFHPQIITSVMRLERVLENDLSRGRWSRHLGSIQLGKARVLFFSGEPESHVVGATASLLLEIDEAQDFDEDKYLKDFRPLGASTNVTTVLYGTAWTGDTLLEHVRQENERLTAQDGVQRNFAYPWPVVARHNPEYGAFVEAEIARMGPEHPLIRTQYLLETLTAGGRLLSETQLAQLLGEHDRETVPSSRFKVQSGAIQSGTLNWEPGTQIYVAGIDLAGEDEEAEDAALRSLQPRRDSTAVTIARVRWDAELGIPEPRIAVIQHYWWTGRKHRELLPQLVDLLRNVWQVQSVVVDATGVGAGIASFLVGALGAEVVHPFTFTAVSKSDLGYQLLAAVNAGRLKVYRPSREGPGRELEEFFRQCRLARSSLHANQRLSFFVDPREGHDDLLISAALAVEAAQHSRPRVAVGRMRVGKGGEGRGEGDRAPGGGPWR